MAKCRSQNQGKLTQFSRTRHAFNRTVDRLAALDGGHLLKGSAAPTPPDPVRPDFRRCVAVWRDRENIEKQDQGAVQGK